MSMLVYPVGSTHACQYASVILDRFGIPLVDHPTPEVTHLLLDVPSFAADGTLRGGGALGHILERLPQNITVAGGNLSHPDLAHYKTVDLLADPEYLAKNAAITADCALRVAGKEMPFVFRGCPVLVIGWGRIGKCLGALLQTLGAEVAIAARKDADRAMIQALGYSALDTAHLKSVSPRFRLVFNTVPNAVLAEDSLSKNCIKIDLASRQGMAGKDVIWARCLPGIYAPESSGGLIAETFLRLIGRN